MGAHLLKRNPREVTWTVLYRSKHKKGQEEDVSKKRNKRTQKFQRAVVGATLADIMAKRNQKPEVRKAQREQAVRDAKEQKKQATTKKAPIAADKKAKKAPAMKNVQNLLQELEERDKRDIFGYKHLCKLICLQ